MSRRYLKLWWRGRGGVQLILFIFDVIKHSVGHLWFLESQLWLSLAGSSSQMQHRLEKCPQGNIFHLAIAFNQSVLP